MKKSIFLALATFLSLNAYSAITTSKEINSGAFKVLLTSSSSIVNKKNKSETFADLFSNMLSQGYSQVGTVCKNSGLNYKCDLVITNLPSSLDTYAVESLIITFYVESYSNGLPSKTIGDFEVSLL